MDFLADYYVRQAGCGTGHANDLFGPVYEGSPHVQRGHSIDSFLAGLFRAVRPLALRWGPRPWAERLSARVQTFSPTSDPSAQTPKSRTSWSADCPRRDVGALTSSSNRTRKRRKEGKAASQKRANKKGKGQYIRGNILIAGLIPGTDTMEYATTRSEFDIFVKKPVQSAVLWSRVTHYKPVAAVDQSDLEFHIPSDLETYVDLGIHLSVRGKLLAHDGSTPDAADSTSVVNNLLHSLLSQCSVTLNEVSVSSSKDLYNYRAYLETLLTYVRDAADTHLTNASWYTDTGNFQAQAPVADTLNMGYQAS
jgi:hypothetical protein